MKNNKSFCRSIASFSEVINHKNDHLENVDKILIQLENFIEKKLFDKEEITAELQIAEAFREVLQEWNITKYAAKKF